MLKFIRQFIFGCRATGINVIKSQPQFRSIEPDSKLKFNDWAQKYQVSTKYGT